MLITKRNQRLYTSLIVICAMIFSMFPFGFLAHDKAYAATAEHVVISEVYGGGGNSGAQYKNDFVELYNPTESVVDLNGWSIQYTSKASTTWSYITELSGEIKPHGYYLVQEAKGSGGTVDLPTPDATGVITMSGSDGKVALVKNSEAISGKADTDVVDFVGFGGANEYEGSGPTPSLSSTASAQRKANDGSDPTGDAGKNMGNGWDTDDNSTDFVTGEPEPQNSSSQAEPSDGQEPPVTNNKPSIDNINYELKPQPNTNVTVYADVYDEDNDKLTVNLLYKNDSAQDFTTIPMTVYEDTTYQASFTVGSFASSFKITASDGKDTTESDIINVATDRESLSILEAKSLPDDTANVTVEGIVTAKLSSSNAYVQDDTSGVLLYGNNSGFDIGYKIRVTGKMTTYNGERELGLDTSKTEILKQGVELPLPNVISLDQVKDTAVQGTLVKAMNLKISRISGTNFYVKEPNGDFEVQVYNQPKITLPSFIKEGSYVTVYGIPAIFNGTYEIKIRGAYDLEAGTPPEDNTPPVITHNPVAEAQYGDAIAINAMITDDLNIPSAKLYYRVKGNTDFISVDMTAEGAAYTSSIPGTAVTLSGIEYYIEASDGKNTSRLPETGLYSINVTEDKTGPDISNELPAPDSVVFSQRPVISANLNDPSGIDESTLIFQLDGKDIISSTFDKNTNTIAYQPAEDLSIDMHTVYLSAKDSLGNESSQTWQFTIMSEGALQHFVGTTHNHTEISHDAKGDPEDALKAAIAHGYDWFTFSEHSHDIDPSSRPGDSVKAPGSDNLFERTGGENWELEKDLADEYTNNPMIKDGKFIVFPAFEMTSTTWGHSNIFGTKNFIDRIQENGKYQDLQNFYAWVLTHPESVAQFNHPGMPEGSFGGFVPYQPDVDSLFTMMEVGNGSGEYSYVNTDYIYYKALDIGWHVAPTFGEDNHDATWGQTPRRTVILADSLTQKSLLDAMKNMRVYMTEDPNLRLEVTANGYPMGSLLPSDGQIKFDIKVWDNVQEDNSYDWVKKSNFKTDDEIENIELITNTGKTIKSIDPAGTSYEGEFDVNSTGHNWYVLKVTQADGQRAYSAPFWTPEVPIDLKMVGVGALPEQSIVGTEVTLSAGLSNLGINEVKNVDVGFYKDSVSEENLIGKITVPSIGSKANATATIKYTPDVAGTITIIAKILNAPEGDNNTDNQNSTTLKVNLPLGITVMIDAGHNNDYANGSLTEVQDQLRQEGFTVVTNTSKLGQDTLKDTDVLIMTQPSGSANYLTADEMQYVSDFVKGGGGLFYCGKGSNNNDPTVSNALLDALGANIHINYDNVYDNDSARQYQGSKSPWAVLIQNFPREDNPVNMIVDRVLNLRYFSGASLVDKSDKDLTDADGVKILAYANPTSYQTDQEGYTSSTTYKYNDPAKMPILAVQDIGDGRVAVTGRGFFSNYEYGSGSDNELLALNIVNWLAKKDLSPTSIGEFRSKPEGTAGVVRGIVTSAAGVFFDAFYLQDETGGIMAYNEVPETADLKPGDIVRVYGGRTVFENNDELTFDRYDADVIKVGHTDPILPKDIKTGDIAKPENQGLLIKTSGQVKGWYNDTSFYIDDGSGRALVFVDGYIVNQSGQLPDIKEGDYVSAVGFPGGFSGGQRIRVRDTKEIIKTDQPEVFVTGVTLDKNSLDLKIGETYTLSASVEPENATNKAVTWSSGDESVATVDNAGKVTAIGAGTATITVTTVDGGKTATCTVNVTKSSSGSGGGSHRDKDTNEGTAQNTDIKNSTVDVSTGGETTINVNDIVKKVDRDALVIKSDNVEVGIPVDQLKNLDTSVSLKIKVDLRPFNPSDVKDSIKNLEAASDIFDITVQIVDKNNNNIGFKFKPVTLKFKFNADNADKSLLGVYYVDEAGKLTYIGGKVADDNSIIANTTHFSKYVVMAYKKTFDDTIGHWAENDIRIMAARHVVNGISEENFAPDMNVTRAQFSALLARALKLDDNSVKTTFADVPADAWYAKELNAVYNAGLVKGIGENKFMPDRYITREEMATMIIRAYEYATNTTVSGSSAKFGDEDKISSWASDFVDKASALDMMKGLGNNLFAPEQYTTRAQAAVTLERLMDKADIY